MDQGATQSGAFSALEYSNAHISHLQQPGEETQTLGPSNADLASSLAYAYPIQESPAPHHPDYATSNKENDPGALAITAPVPLSYAARSKDALRSILSTGGDSPHTDFESVQNDASHAETPDDKVADMEFANTQPKQLFQWHDLRLAMLNRADDPSNTSLYDRQSAMTQPTMIIRPISASTLMALTEPCLMKWWLDPDDELLCGPTSGLGPPPVAAVQYNAVQAPSGTMNSWGY
ncbi:hypothetical protein BJ912DRAFT_1041828 [Pholiota molesta]|nr:hypothetical protein BJ912DRAFT_1041828 [Pholiota molesta]